LMRRALASVVKAPLVRVRSDAMHLRRMSIYRLGDDTPTLAEGAWVAPNAAVMGKVKLCEGASVWFNATIRGDNELCTVGKGSNIQDGSVLHTDKGFPLDIGENVTVGHMAMLHGCKVGDGSLIGIGATVLNGVNIGKNCLIGAHALIPEGREIPDGSLVMGAPGKVVKQLTPEQIAKMHQGAGHYVTNAARYAKDLEKIA